MHVPFALLDPVYSNKGGLLVCMIMMARLSNTLTFQESSQDVVVKIKIKSGAKALFVVYHFTWTIKIPLLDVLMKC